MYANWKDFDIYLVIAKCQHGVCKINQLPWKFDGKINEFLSNLEDFKENMKDFSNNMKI